MPAPTQERSLVTGPEVVRLTAWIRGRVQGVGMRWWIRSQALELGLVGSARNLEDGRVEVVAEGSEAACRSLLGALGSGRSPGRIDVVVERWSPARGLAENDDTGFRER